MKQKCAKCAVFYNFFLANKMTTFIIYVHRFFSHLICFATLRFVSFVELMSNNRRRSHESSQWKHFVWFLFFFCLLFRLFNLINRILAMKFSFMSRIFIFIPHKLRNFSNSQLSNKYTHKILFS